MQAQANGDKIPALNKAIAEAMTLLKLEDFADKAKSGGAPIPQMAKTRCG